MYSYRNVEGLCDLVSFSLEGKTSALPGVSGMGILAVWLPEYHPAVRYGWIPLRVLNLEAVTSCVEKFSLLVSGVIWVLAVVWLSALRVLHVSRCPALPSRKLVNLQTSGSSLKAFLWRASWNLEFPAQGNSDKWDLFGFGGFTGKTENWGFFLVEVNWNWLFDSRNSLLFLGMLR